MPKAIIVRNSGNSRQSVFQLNGDGDNLQLEVVEFGEPKGVVIFTGSNFSPEQYEQHGGIKEEKEFFSKFPKKKKK